MARRRARLLAVLGAALFWGPLGVSTRALAQDEPIPQPEGDMDVTTFDETLSPYGQWVDTGEGPNDGRAWRPDPDVVGEDFQPYATGGHWVYSDWGWTWESDYPWGWAPYHYGRWALTPSWGWVWYPGTVWAPAWVDWRFGGGYIGWAPLPPWASRWWSSPGGPTGASSRATSSSTATCGPTGSRWAASTRRTPRPCPCTRR